MTQSTSAPPKQARHRVMRSSVRARYDTSSVHAILDAGLLAHVGFCMEDQPFVIPMLYAREGNALLLHGSVASRLIDRLGSGLAACVSVTHVDGLVLARSHFHHSVNYRSVVAFGHARLIEEEAAKLQALWRIVDTLIPGRAVESRSPDSAELAATRVLRFEIDDASAKIRSGGVTDNAADLELPIWAGVLPVHTIFGAPEPEIGIARDAPLPASVVRLLVNSV